MKTRQYRLGQISYEKVTEFIKLYLLYPKPKTNILVRILGMPANDNQQVYLGLYDLYACASSNLVIKTFGEVRSLFRTASGQQLLELYFSAYGMGRSKEEQYVPLTSDERIQFGKVLATMDQLWLTAHEEAGMLVDDSISRETINQAILEAKQYLAERREAFAELPLSPEGALVARSA